jgi:hypothetical protein
LTVEAGSVVKVRSTQTGFQVNAGGRLEVAGTAAAPVVMTSADDPGPGGDWGTGDDDPNSIRPAGQLIDVMPSGTEVLIRHADLGHASRAVGSRTCPWPPQPSSVTIVDSVLRSPVELNGCGADVREIFLERNEFRVRPAVGTTDALNLRALADLSGVVLDAEDRNTFHGQPTERIVRIGNSYVRDGSHWAMTSAGGANLLLWPSSGAGIYVQDSGSLTVAAGSVLKVSQWNHTGFQVNAGGRLEVAGTAAAPVVMTSADDPGPGGDWGTGDDNSDSIRPAGQLIDVSDGADVVINEAEMRYAGFALRQTGGVLSVVDSSLGTPDARVGTALVQSSGDASIRGQVAVIDFGVRSCSWGTEDCGVDAARVDWSNPDGPSGLVCGQVWASPYLHNGIQLYSGLWTTDSCAPQSTPPEKLATSVDFFYEALAEVRALCIQTGDPSACDAVDTAMSCLSGAYYSAGGGSPFDFPTQTETPDFDKTYSKQVVAAAIAFLSSSDIPTVRTSGRLMSVVNIANTAITLGKLDTAYRACAP